VFAGHDDSGKPVAVKRLHVTAEAAAHRELKIAVELAGREFRHVIPILDAGQDAESDRYFVVMPQAVESLQDFIDSNGAMEEQKAIEVLLQIADGLGEVPDIVHRDLKPANILLLDGAWRVADFGIARFVEEATSTRTLKDCLSPQYAAPEQWRFEHATRATDIYSLGCIAQALMSGAPPFEGSIPTLQEKHLHESPPAIRGIGPQLQMLVSMMLRKQGDARPSLERIVRILKAVPKSAGAPMDAALQGLAAAASDHEKKAAAAAAEALKAETLRATRIALASEARVTLKAISDALIRHITSGVPTASIENTPTSVRVRVASATLELDLGKNTVFAADSFPRSGWDVLCGGIVQVDQGNPTHRRSANLWYTRQRNQSGEYRWYEVGYEGNPITGQGFQFEPAAVTPDLADRAHWNGMDVIQVSCGPFLVDDEHIEWFLKRWTHAFAAASAMRLQHMARGIPERGPF
jgi:serine/threonine protein kinase